jgi:hypothetical protein
MGGGMFLALIGGPWGFRFFDATVAPNTSPASRIESQAKLTGALVLDMIVCYGCCLRASELGLDTETIEVRRYAVR